MGHTSQSFKDQKTSISPMLSVRRLCYRVLGERGDVKEETSLLPPHATRRNSLGAAGKLRSARAIIPCDQPRSSSAIPIDRTRNQNPDHGQSAHSRIPSKSVTAPSKAAQPQLGNFSLVGILVPRPVNRNCA